MPVTSRDSASASAARGLDTLLPCHAPTESPPRLHLLRNHLVHALSTMRVPAAAGAPVIDRGSPAFARRIAAFDKVAVTGIKELVDRAALPDRVETDPGAAIGELRQNSA
jgi:hypothetical protein